MLTETHLRERLTTATDAIEGGLDADAVIQRGQRLRRRRRTTGVGALSATALAVICIVQVAGSGDRAPTTLNVSGVGEGWFRVGAPTVMPISRGGLVLIDPQCRADQVHAAVDLRRSPDGVAGVVTLTGPKCGLSLDPSSVRLLDAAHRVIAVWSETPQNPVAAPSGELSPATSPTLGFRWSGSWCGATPTTLSVAMLSRQSARIATLEAPITEPASGTCRGSSTAQLLVGTTGHGDDAVLPPPPEWSSLRATLDLSDAVVTDAIRGARLVLRNTGASTVALEACPQYSADVSVTDEHGTTITGALGAGGCDATAPSLPPDASLSVGLGPLPIAETAAPGTTADVSVAIAGVATAEGKVTVPGR